MLSFFRGRTKAGAPSKRSLSWRLLLPLPITLVVAILSIWFVVPDVVRDNATDEAIRAGQQTANQFKQIRAYYTENVVGKVAKESTLKVSSDHRSNDKAVPLPATMIHDLSALLAQQDTTVNLYSAYPFPNRASRKLDDFQQAAWEALVQDPARTFSRNEIRDGRHVVRVAVADTMAAQACVTCHNTDSTSPKKNWKLGDVRGVLEVTSVIDTQLAAGTALSNWIVVGAIAIGLILLGITFVTARSVAGPIRALSSSMLQLAARKNDIEITGAERGDEIGEMSRAVLVFRDAAVEKERLETESDRQREATDQERKRNAEAEARAAGEQSQAVRALADGLRKVSEGDLTIRLSDGFTGDYQQIRDDFNATVEALQDTIGSIVQATREVTNTASEISASTTDLSQRTEEQAASLEQTSASMEQMAATVKKNAENAQQANQFAVDTRRVANQGGEIVGEAVESMARIEDSSKKISDIIGVIDEIAFQTNLLALNAAVEAARAGEAGRGFAVVAAEVRSLAQRASQAAKDIKDLINSSSDHVQEGVELVNRAGTALTDIVRSIEKVAGIVTEIASASSEQATGIDQINTALAQMDEVTQQNSALVEENAASAKSLEEQAASMDGEVSRFKVGAASHAENVRPAAKSVAPGPAIKLRAAEPPRRPAPAKAGARGPVARMQAAVATAFKDDPEWKEF